MGVLFFKWAGLGRVLWSWFYGGGISLCRGLMWGVLICVFRVPSGVWSRIRWVVLASVVYAISCGVF